MLPLDEGRVGKGGQFASAHHGAFITPASGIYYFSFASTGDLFNQKVVPPTRIGDKPTGSQLVGLLTKGHVIEFGMNNSAPTSSGVPLPYLSMRFCVAQGGGMCGVGTRTNKRKKGEGGGAAKRRRGVRGRPPGPAHGG